MLIAHRRGGADDVVDHLQGDTPGAHRRLPASLQNPQDLIMLVPFPRVTVRWPAKAAWAAFCASRRRSCHADADPACPES